MFLISRELWKSSPSSLLHSAPTCKVRALHWLQEPHLFQPRCLGPSPPCQPLKPGDRRPLSPSLSSKGPEADSPQPGLDTSVRRQSLPSDPPPQHSSPPNTHGHSWGDTACADTLADTLTGQVTTGSYKTLEPGIKPDTLKRLRVKATHCQLICNTFTVASEPQMACPS